MKQQKKAKKADRGLMSGASRFASRNRTALRVAGAGMAAAAALLLGKRYRDQRQVAQWDTDQPVGGTTI